MIEKYGEVIITEGAISFRGFSFTGVSLNEAQDEARSWAMMRIIDQSHGNEISEETAQKWVESGLLEPFWDVQSSKPFPSALMKYTHVTEVAYAEKLRAALKMAVSALDDFENNGANRGMGWTPAQHAVITKAKISQILEG
jgi:hypothetical protein